MPFMVEGNSYMRLEYDQQPCMKKVNGMPIYMQDISQVESGVVPHIVKLYNKWSSVSHSNVWESVGNNSMSAPSKGSFLEEKKALALRWGAGISRS